MEIKTVTVIGANGTMGCNISGIFASFGNAKVYMACRSLEKAEKAVTRAAKSVRAEAIAENLVPVTFDDLPQCVSESDLIFESVSENFETKQDIIDRIAAHVRPDAILATAPPACPSTSSQRCTPRTCARVSSACTFSTLHI